MSTTEFRPVGEMLDVVRRRAAQRQRRMRATVSLAVAVFVLAAAAVVAVRDDGTTERPTVVDDFKSWKYTPLPSSPLSPRLETAVAWTGRELIVWGGAGPMTHQSPVGMSGDKMVWSETGPGGQGETYNDGAAFNPRTRTWRALPPSPLRSRYAALAGWTGREFVVWGGRVSPRGPASGGWELFDGAAYDPVGDRWRPIVLPEQLRDAYRVQSFAEGALLIGGQFKAAYYDPASDKWSPLPPTAGHLYVADGSVFAVEQPEFQAPARVSEWKPSASTWEDRPSVSAAEWKYAPLNPVWTGDGFVSPLTVQGGGAGANETSFGSAWDPASGSVDILRHGRSGGVGGPPQNLMWTGTHLLTPSLAYDPATDVWSDLPAATGVTTGLHKAFWTGESVLLFVSPYPSTEGVLKSDELWRLGPE